MAACHPGDPVVTLHEFPPSECVKTVFGIDDRYVYLPDGTGLLRVPKTGGAPETMLSGYAYSAHVNALGVFASMMNPGCTMVPCGELVHLDGKEQATALASAIGVIYMLTPWGTDGIAVAHTYPDPMGQISAISLHGSAPITLAHTPLGVIDPVLDGNVVYIRDHTDPTGVLRSIDLMTGSEATVPGATDVQSTAAVVNGFIYFTDSQGNLDRIAESGGTQEVVASGFDNVIGREVLIGNQGDVIFNVLPMTPGPNSGNDGKIVAVDAQTGTVRSLAGAPDVSEVGFAVADDACVYWSDARWASEGGPDCASVSLKKAPR